MEELVPQTQECSQCNALLKEEQKFCTSCGFPERGTEDEKSRFHSIRVMNGRRSNEAEKKIKSARKSLYFISAISFLFGVVYFFTRDDTATFIASTILAVIYIALAFWTQQRPLVALLLGLLVFLTTMVANALMDPNTIYKGILVKIIVLIYLVKGISSALDVRKLKTAE